MSHPARGAWIEIKIILDKIASFASHPARGAWIEIRMWDSTIKTDDVAPRTGCVD